MLRSVLGVVVAFVVVGSAAAPTMAHHSFAAQYDRDKPVSLNGTVTRIEWRYLDG